MKIYLIRHGQTDANKNAIIQGRANNPLNQTGRQQALQTGMYLKKLKIDFDHCITSPLDRAIETAQIIKNEMNLSLEDEIDERIIERDFGDFDGKKIQEDYFAAVHEGKIPKMETDFQIEKRVNDFFSDYCKNNKHKNVLMVAHSHVIKALLVKQIADFNYDTYLSNCSINIISCKDKIDIIDYNIDPLEQ